MDLSDPPRAAASPSSRSARATACRTSRPRSRPPTRSRFVDRLSAAGACRSSRCRPSCSPKWVPQMARRGRGVRAASRGGRARATPRSCPNLAGLDRALAAGVTGNRDLRGVDRDLQPQEHQPEHRRVARHLRASSASGAHRPRLRVRGYLSTAFGCPYEGDVAPERGRQRSPRDCSTWACSRSPSATRSASRIRAR